MYKLSASISVTTIKILLFYISSFFLCFSAYFLFINPIYSYMGFEWRLNLIKLMEATAIVIFLCALLPKTFSKPSDFLLHLHFCFPILPMAVLYGANDEPRFFFYGTVISFVIVILMALFVKPKRLRLIKLNYRFLEKTLLVISYSLIISILLIGGHKYINFDILKVYENRDAAADNLPGIYGYLSPLVSKVLLPFSLLLAMFNRHYLVVILSITGSILMFGLTSHKSSLFFPFALIALYFILNKKQPIILLIFSYFIIIIFSIIFFTLYADQSLFGSLILRRVYFVPAHINYIYYDFFSTHPLSLWSQSKMTLGLIKYPYDLDISHLIGLNYYQSEQIGANTGWLGSGYANAGFYGMLIYALITGFTFATLDAYAKVVGKALATSISFAPIFTLMTSSDLPTAFLNHGILLVFLLFSFFPVNPNHKKANYVYV